MLKLGIAFPLITALLIAGACGSPAPAPTPVPTPEPTETPIATATPEPTAEPEPAPTATPAPEVDPTPTPQVTGLFEYMRAVRLLRVQEFDDAVTAFDLVIRKLPDFGRAYYGRGQAFHGDERPELALEDFATSIELEPDHPGAYIARAKLYLERNQREEARTDLRTALEVANPIRDWMHIAEAEQIVANLGGR